jgi:hypothetical protein
MAALDEFASVLLEEAKRFLEKAGESTDPDCKRAYLHSALLLGFAAFEAHVNAIADDFLSLNSLQPHERGLLSEQAVELSDGEFKLKRILKIQRLVTESCSCVADSPENPSIAKRPAGVSSSMPLIYATA